MSIPDDALDDRLGFIGTSGSGKTFAAKGAAERLLHRGHRAVIVDPLDVWYGLRVALDGVTPAFPIAILGGKHGDLALNEHAGALIGETVARSPESCIVSLGGIRTSAARERFMLAFLDALYEHTDPDTADPYHVIFDEADLWAPQRPMGNQAMLCHLMEEIVRRGRVKGFIPWLITQRPAVLNKNVLSQVDGLIALKLTSSQDRDAIGAWIEGQADRQQGKDILAGLPTLDRGTGVVWIPGRNILSTESFPLNVTFDSSRTPKRGEAKRTATLKPLDLAGLKAKLVTVEEEAKENDPKRLKARIAELEKMAGEGGADEIAKLREQRDALRRELNEAAGEYRQKEASSRSIIDRLNDRLARAAEIFRSIAEAAESFPGVAGKAISDAGNEPITLNREAIRHLAVPSDERITITQAAAPPPKPHPTPSLRKGDGQVSGQQQRILDALAWWESVGIAAPTRVQIAVVAGYSPEGGAFQNPLGAMRTAGLIEYPSPGAAGLTAAGRRLATRPERPAGNAELHTKVAQILDGPRRRILEPLLRAYPRAMTRDQLASASGYEASGGAFQNPLGALRSLGLVDYPERGKVVALPVLFIEGRKEAARG